MLGAGEGSSSSPRWRRRATSPRARRGEAISFFSLSLYLGLAFGPPIAEVLFAATDGSYQVIWLAALAVAALAAVLSVLVPESAPAVRNAEGEARPRGRAVPPCRGLSGHGYPARPVRDGRLPVVPTAVHAFGRYEGAGLPLAAYALIVVGLRVVGATWPDRFGAARLSGAALALSSAGLLVIGLVPTPIGLMVGTVIFASGVAFTMPALLTLAVSRVPPEERGSVVGTTTVFLDVVFGFAPMVLGAVADVAGYGATFLVSAVAAAAGALLVAARNRVARPVAVERVGSRRWASMRSSSAAPG